MFLGIFFYTLCWYSVHQSQFYLQKYMDVQRPESPFTPHTVTVEAKIFALENVLRKARSKLSESYDAAAAELRDHTGAIEDLMFELGYELEFDDEEFLWEPPDPDEPPAKLARSDNNNGGGLDDGMVDS
jgi:hypothetical protein